MTAQIIGWIGMVLLLGAHFLNSKGWTKGSIRKLKLFQWMNVAGGIAVAISAFAKNNWPVVGLESAWAIIGAFALWRIRRSWPTQVCEDCKEEGPLNGNQCRKCFPSWDAHLDGESKIPRLCDRCFGYHLETHIPGYRQDSPPLL